MKWKETHDEIIAWAKCTLNIRQSDDLFFSVVVSTPWSYVLRLVVGGQVFYLKQTQPSFSAEPSIILLMKQKCQAKVAHVIARSEKWRCFLMRDAGVKLRDLLKEAMDEALLLQTMAQFASMQMQSMHCLDDFFSLGVPDYGLDKIPQLYENLISQKAFRVLSGLSDDAFKKCCGLMRRVSDLCAELSYYPGSQGIVQLDFNDNNTVIDGYKNITMIDVGEVVVSYPLLSLVNFLLQMEKHHGIGCEAPLYQSLVSAYRQHYPCFSAPAIPFQRMLDLAKQLHLVVSVLYQDRFIKVCGAAQLRLYGVDGLGVLVQQWLAASGARA